MSFKITWKTHLICLLVAIMITESMGGVLDIILNKFLSRGIISYPTNNLLFNFYIIVAFTMIPICMIHELIHGITFKLFGGKVKYGFKIIYAYTQEVSNMPIDRNKFLIVLLSPVVIISIASMLFSPWIGGLVYFFNLIGSIGDLYMAFVLCRYNYDSKIIDREYGFDVVR
ncbi:DUF3267 domain-containing protein [Clostridium sp. OS1-26]|uniref:DUF3267 domain-containing protein n=1 Tax=Clostridium sp. OS1-26 TaxID=3070681 RepID=UPI0027E1AD73|nr:DUF3267 domain-containing protein [Clostridium sp. OS1-26]WML34163.1 DUF3267 domain-containing protein [Clostridium sp. OS1-26]